jgi:hypothetical protein
MKRDSFTKRAFFGDSFCIEIQLCTVTFDREIGSNLLLNNNGGPATTRRILVGAVRRCRFRQSRRVNEPAPGSRGWAAEVTVIITPVADVRIPRSQLAHLA